MKKIIYACLILTSLTKLSAMDCWPSLPGSPRAEGSKTPHEIHSEMPTQASEQIVLQRQEDQNQELQADTGWSISGLLNLLPELPNPLTVIADAMNQVDQAYGAGAAQRQEEANQHAEHVRILLEELKTKRLPHAIQDAAEQASPRKFISLLIGMKAQGMEPCDESKVTIRHRLNLLQLERRQETREQIEKRMTQERQIHALRKLFKNGDEVLSDDESYTRLDKFADRLVNDEE